MLQRFKVVKTVARFASNKSSGGKVLERLEHRSLIRVKGPEAAEYLQGLITNDVRHLENGPGSMFAMFLNTKGRVMYDAIIYRSAQEGEFLIECDRSGHEALQKQLKMFRVRRKISIENIDDECSVYAVFNSHSPLELNNNTNAPNTDRSNGTKDEELLVPCDTLNSTLPRSTAKFYKDLTIYKDPRINLLGSRILAPNGTNVQKQISDLFALEQSTLDYKQLRYVLGVGEGTADLPPNNNFPLESNCDYLHGVSFHKGCYIGQELTARTYHTGVIRKRLMPLQFIKVPTEWPKDCTIVNEGDNLGKLRTVYKDTGLALLRIQKVLDLEQFPVGDGLAKVVRPPWWPLEASKEKLNVQKT